MGAPVNETTTFPQDTPTIYCSVLVSGITTPVDLLSEWYYVQGALEGVTNQLISVPEDQYVWFSLDMPDNGWPAGEYEFVLYMNGALAVELPFTVVAPGATGTSIKLSEATTAVNIDSSARPVGPTSAFQAGTGKVYVTFVAAPDVAPGSTVVSEWYAMSSGSPVLMDSFSLDVTPGHYHALYYEIPGGWPAGQYAVILYLGGVQQAVLAFSVA